VRHRQSSVWIVAWLCTCRMTLAGLKATSTPLGSACVFSQSSMFSTSVSVTWAVPRVKEEKSLFSCWAKWSQNRDESTWNPSMFRTADSRRTRMQKGRRSSGQKERKRKMIHQSLWMKNSDLAVTLRNKRSVCYRHILYRISNYSVHLTILYQSSFFKAQITMHLVDQNRSYA
jgi:hypothetical protein